MNAARLSLGLFIAGVALGLVQLWLSPWSEATFARLAITVAALLLVSLVVLYYQREGRQHDNIHRGGDIDD
jgi:hypothetical protein